ncbi:MAG: hypothetical protein V7L21_24740 [Nostoc sp.]|uniref:hypothetical protein n=1 Tax=unclassified Nostoc TaxID=2593658 RepID=UPI0025EAACDB|nr:hypothetical protein [Nostoc sp. NMS9]MBN3942558.1 hypothetical protein [Nostoc sp. NMS9]
MKLTTLINSTVIIASLAFTSGIASAQTVTSINTAVNPDPLGSNSTSVSYIQPFNLVNLAYQGGLKQQGVPSGGALISEGQRGNITPKDLVKAAINAKKLPVQVLNNQDYISAVSSQLGILTGVNYPE